MHTLIVWTAQYLLWVMVAAFVVIWVVAENRAGKVRLGASAVLGLVLVAVFLVVARHVHHDPRPFVADPHVKPLFGHSRDDGFPSDHCLAAGLIAILIFFRHRLAGLILALAAAAIAWARVAAHVHHLQDVVAGLLLGALAAVIATVVIGVVIDRVPRLRALDGPSEPPRTARHASGPNG